MVACPQAGHSKSRFTLEASGSVKLEVKQEPDGEPDGHDRKVLDCNWRKIAIID